MAKTATEIRNDVAERITELRSELSQLEAIESAVAEAPSTPKPARRGRPRKTPATSSTPTTGKRKGPDAFLALVKERPGITAHEAQAALGLANVVSIYGYIKKLPEGAINIVKDGRTAHYHPGEGKPQTEKPATTQSKPKTASSNGRKKPSTAKAKASSTAKKPNAAKAKSASASSTKKGQAAAAKKTSSTAKKPSTAKAKSQEKPAGDKTSQQAPADPSGNGGQASDETPAGTSTAAETAPTT